MSDGRLDAERARLEETKVGAKSWRKWGPYLSERQCLLLFFEYFHGDDGAGLGASHQTGWTGLVAPLTQLCHLDSSFYLQSR